MSCLLSQRTRLYNSRASSHWMLEVRSDVVMRPTRALADPTHQTRSIAQTCPDRCQIRTMCQLRRPRVTGRETSLRWSIWLAAEALVTIRTVKLRPILNPARSTSQDKNITARMSLTNPISSVPFKLQAVVVRAISSLHLPRALQARLSSSTCVH